jgi:hypothetical protein
VTINPLELGAAIVTNLIAMWGLVERNKRDNAQRLEDRFKELGTRLTTIEQMASKVDRHDHLFADGNRDIAALTQRLDRLEGGLSAQVRSVEAGMFSIGKEVAELRGELRVAGMVRGLVGKRDSDRVTDAG